MRTAAALLLLCTAAEAQSLLGDSGGSPYDPPKPREWKRHDRLQIRFGAPENPKAPAASFTIAAEVADVRPNGVLVIQALRRRAAGGAVESLKVSGEVPPGAVVDGVVAADRVANLCVAIEGAAASRLPDWLARLFEGVLPN